jgi:transposase
MVREGRKEDHEKLPRRRSFGGPPRRWAAERAFARISHNRRMSKGHEGLCATAEAFIYAAMTRLVMRRLARA